MEKSYLTDIKENIENRVKADVIVGCFDDGKIYVVITPLDRCLLWGKVFTTQVLDDLTPNQVGRLVKDEFEKFIISLYIKC